MKENIEKFKNMSLDELKDCLDDPVIVTAIHEALDYLRVRLNLAPLRMEVIVAHFVKNDEEWASFNMDLVPFSPKELGIFKYALDECFVRIETHANKAKNKVMFVPKLRYSHRGGGKNGCTLCVQLEYINGMLLER